MQHSTALKQDQPIKLNAATIEALPPEIERPHYRRSNLAEGILHMSCGAFHRAHQAYYLHNCFQQGAERSWALCSVGLKPQDTPICHDLKSQDYFYTLVERNDSGVSAQVIGSIVNYLYGPDNPEAVIAKLASGRIKLVTLTLTEGGYYYNEENKELNLEAPDIKHDLQYTHEPVTGIGYLVAGLNRCYQKNQRPFAILSCDNLQANGDTTRKVVLEMAMQINPALANWISDNVPFPNCMVDRITPATSDRERNYVRERFGIDDTRPVICEPFSQWIIEEWSGIDRPNLELAGAQFVNDVKPYELMKLRLLNAGHSAIGYFGALLGYQYIHEIVQDPLMNHFLRQLLTSEVKPLLKGIPAAETSRYIDTVLTRFSNSTLQDQTERICSNGSAKLPKFLLPSIAKAEKLGRSRKLLTLAVASWCRYLTGEDEQGNNYEIKDQIARLLTEKAKASGKSPDALLTTQLFGELSKNAAFVNDLRQSLSSLYQYGTRTTVANYLK